jgi:hopanoid biosynthesis associated RND transporter like protein HpnN
VVLAALSAFYTAKNFAINTDINQLLSPELPWRKQELAYEKAFPNRYDKILAVLDAPTSERASVAAAELVQKLSGQPELFHAVTEFMDSPFFRQNALLFLPTEEVAQKTAQLIEGQPLIQTLAADPSLRGLSQGLTLVLVGSQAGHFQFDSLADPLNKFATTLEDVVAGRPAVFSWRELLSGRPAEPGDLRRYIDIRPVLDFDALEPGKRASIAIRKAAEDLAAKYGARVRLTGPVAIADEEFATVREGSVVNDLGTVVIVLFILWLALRSTRIIAAVALTLVVGLAMTAAAGLMMVGALNLISIAFAVLFVGIGVDFGLQFAVRYRAERSRNEDLFAALESSGARIGAPLTLAAAATAAGFLAFLPTDYRGVAELGQIAGVGMIIAFLTSITVLPAFLWVFNPPGESEPPGFSALAPVDRFLERYRTPILIGTGLIVLGGLPLLYKLSFDFNPMHLRSPHVESMATFLEIRSDPATGANAVDVLVPSETAARAAAERLQKVPEVSRVTMLDSFVPQDQETKLGHIRDAKKTLEPDLTAPVQKPPTDAQTVAALKEAEKDLNDATADRNGPGTLAAKRLANVLSELVKANPSVRAKAEQVLVPPLKLALDDLRDVLKAQPVTKASLPEWLAHDWMTPDGRMRVQALPKGDPNDNDTLRAFARAVLAVEPTAIGGPISILKTGDVMVHAFIEAAAWALISIAILLWIMLRRLGDVLLTLIPLLVAGAVTLELCVLLDLPLNFANIIALPLLLGIGVAFKIYYIMAWRAGQTNLLQSTLTRAVIFSSATTATAFGSLWLSSHPGTSSMGKLLALSLACTMLAAVFFQPMLMGRPRELEDS